MEASNKQDREIESVVLEGNVLVKSSSVNANHNPGTRKQRIGLLKVLDILKSFGISI